MKRNSLKVLHLLLAIALFLTIPVQAEEESTPAPEETAVSTASADTVSGSRFSASGQNAEPKCRRKDCRHKKFRTFSHMLSPFQTRRFQHCPIRHAIYVPWLSSKRSLQSYANATMPGLRLYVQNDINKTETTSKTLTVERAYNCADSHCFGIIGSYP